MGWQAHYHVPQNYQVMLPNSITCGHKPTSPSFPFLIFFMNHHCLSRLQEPPCCHMLIIPCTCFLTIIHLIFLLIMFAFYCHLLNLFPSFFLGNFEFLFFLFFVRENSEKNGNVEELMKLLRT